MKAFIAALFLILLLHGEAAGAFLQVKGAFHVHTNFSTGALSPEEVAAEAHREGIDSVIFAENLLLHFEYGVFPLRGLLKKVVEKPSVLRRGIGRWLHALEAANARFPDVILIPGVEVVPYYYWTGSPFRGDLTLRDTQKNLVVVGLRTAEDYRKLPAIGNGGTLSPPGPHLLQPALGLALVGLGILLMRTEREQNIQLKHFLLKGRKRHRLSGWLALGAGTLFLLEAFSASGLDPYQGDLGIGPYQRVIDAAEARGGMVFWSYPEARDFHTVRSGLVGTLTIRTEPHPQALLHSHGYTGFGAVYQDTVTLTEPGHEWDQLLLQYAEGRRGRPAWGIGEVGYHGPPNRLGNVLTVFLVSHQSREGILEALKSGRFYSVRPKSDYRLVLEDFSIGHGGGSQWTPMGGEFEASGKDPLRIRLRIGASDGRDVDVAVRLIRSGRLVDVRKGRTPFAETLKVMPPDRGRREFFRIEVAPPHRLLSNPIFVRSQA
ncbi:MAG: hypothetical protein ACE5IQ_13470 [Candidatus Methylomirabilales bacterium]